MTKRPILLGINIDHVATLRQQRHTIYPEPIRAGLLAEEAGADSITVHLREDLRHIQPLDVTLLKEKLQTPLNLEIAVTDDMIAFAAKIKPTYCCLVPEKRLELTTEGGLNVMAEKEKVANACEKLAKANIKVSLFIDPDRSQIDAALACNVPMIELHTGTYADATNPNEIAKEFERIKTAAIYAHAKGLQVNVGHGLHYQNVLPLAEIPQLVEFNIGHSIIARAIFTGMKSAVIEMKQLLLKGRELCNEI